MNLDFETLVEERPYHKYMGKWDKQAVALTFHLNTVNGPFARRLPKEPGLAELKQSALNFKEYAGSPKLALGSRELELGGCSLGRALQTRRSAENFAGKPLTLAEVGQLLQAADGISTPATNNRFYQGRTAPSGGALYPLEIYMVALRPADFEPGLYHYGAREHVLEQLAVGDFSKAAKAACGFFGDKVEQASAIFFISAIFNRTLDKYGSRGYRYILLEAGHVGQNFYLAGAALNLGILSMGSFVERQVEKLLGLDGIEESPVYALAVGSV